ncbi:MAG: hypothetical protein LCH41_06790 [Armatimonadetes bacterium]|nr:hypothetical protein [Armatimonadota bacterium]
MGKWRQSALGIVVAIVFAVLVGIASFAERDLVNGALIAGVIGINLLPLAIKKTSVGKTLLRILLAMGLAIVILLPFSHPVVLAMKVCAVEGLVRAVGT